MPPLPPMLPPSVELAEISYKFRASGSSEESARIRGSVCTPSRGSVAGRPSRASMVGSHLLGAFIERQPRGRTWNGVCSIQRHHGSAEHTVGGWPEWCVLGTSDSSNRWPGG
jgi:hypothetical protein